MGNLTPAARAEMIGRAGAGETGVKDAINAEYKPLSDKIGRDLRCVLVDMSRLEVGSVREGRGQDDRFITCFSPMERARGFREEAEATIWRVINE